MLPKPTSPRLVQVLTIDDRPVRCRVSQPAADPQTPAPRLPLVLLHGLGCSSDAWLPTTDALAPRGLACPVYVPDMPGFGHSPGPREALGMEDLGDWTARLLDALSVDRAHIGGNSMGCQVALALARRHPDRVGGLVLVGPTIGEQYVPAWRYAAGLVLDAIHEPLYYNAILAHMYWQMGMPRYFATTEKMLHDAPLLHADEVHARCLILRGSQDAIIPDTAARRLTAKLTHAEFRRMPGMPHALQYSRSREFCDAALPFWAASEANGANQ